VGVYMGPRGRWTEKVWEPLLYSNTSTSHSVTVSFSLCEGKICIKARHFFRSVQKCVIKIVINQQVHALYCFII
jgi:hypothetical protein